jgi:hypothetical protein
MFRDVECIVASESQINKCKADVEIFEKRFGVSFRINLDLKILLFN